MNKQKIVIIILSILVCALAVTLIVLVQNNQPKEVIGTYCAEGPYPAESIYLSLFRDETIEIWRSDFRYRGAYTTEPYGETIRIRITGLDGTNTTALFDQHDQVILDGNPLESLPNTLLSFKRINDVPGRPQ